MQYSPRYRSFNLNMHFWKVHKLAKNGLLNMKKIITFICNKAHNNEVLRVRFLQLNVYWSWKACPLALMQRVACVTMQSNERWIICWSMLRHSVTIASRSCLELFSCSSCGTFQILCFKYPQRKKSHTVRSGERGGQGQSPCLLITLPGNWPRRHCIVALLVCKGAPPCCQNMAFLSMSLMGKSLCTTL